jgi:hypothetical protein
LERRASRFSPTTYLEKLLDKVTCLKKSPLSIERMLDLNFLFESLMQFSHTQCVGICAVLVPANLLATLQTLLMVGFGRPLVQARWMSAIASLYALLMVLHVATWFMIGVIMMPTFILLGLATMCLGINGWAIAHPLSLRHSLQILKDKAFKIFNTARPLAN